MPERGRARSLAEGYVYLDLTVRDGEGGAAERATLREGEDAWTLHLDGVEVEVSYQGETTARLTELTFGEGVSELVDAGQWVFVAETYARTALDDGLTFAVGPGDDKLFAGVAAGWELAADALAEALKFLPPGTDSLPPQAFWTPMGVSLREANPERFTRERLESDLLFYRQSLEDLSRLHHKDGEE
ncbi:hypothetical protein [Nonomuraea dietziae]|uniref:hypothetical protein n=1 Tax=Nonomuraea dietziae TaxID=65515 RepID=UPI0033D62530